ncbi:MAG: hypothetical protein SPG06_01680 [Eubacteriales bacterium]|nr:hypothetical protein [Eubacteriales bacterium]
MAEFRSISGSVTEDLFIDIFADTFGAEKAGYLYSQYPFFDIYQNARVVLYFYTKNNTPGCTRQACAFCCKIKKLNENVVD